MTVKLSSMPDPPKEYIVDFDRLDGGLNTWELDYRLDRNQSPDMKNMWWLDGALCCRDGQTRVTGDSVLGVGYSAYELPFWDCFFYHIGTKLYRSPVPAADAQPGEVTLTELYSGVPENRGTWFRYEDSLFYKNRGAYLKIDYDAEDESFQAAPVTPYDPIIQINTEPTTAAGDAYQPENRLSPTKTVWYSTVSGVKEYHLPVQDVDSVDSVVVDGEELTAETDYTVDLEAGTVTFTTEPEHHDPVQVNTVKITYTKENQDAYDSVMDCPYAAVYGGNQNVCVVVGGCPAQPNAYYWCGNHIVMDPGYFPMEQYNFAGDTEESITGFGKQQSMLVIFKQHSIGRADISTTEMASGRVMITMDYTNINSRIGCDLPWTIQLVENNLVFCNTEQGVHIVKDSSAAYENNVVSLSRNVNGTAQRPGLLAAVRAADNVESFDDDRRYWVVADGEAYVWDYTLSGYSEPSWFYFTGILGVAFMKHNENGFHLDAQAEGIAISFGVNHPDGSAGKLDLQIIQVHLGPELIGEMQLIAMCCQFHFQLAGGCDIAHDTFFQPPHWGAAQIFQSYRRLAFHAALRMAMISIGRFGHGPMTLGTFIVFTFKVFIGKLQRLQSGLVIG